ncbi:hypothetical protein GCM10011591_23040 [Nocardia camponoti]|uniref:NADPH-dependent FMN reductase-like domain-containing protein n=1 Tax=Nocardia camponoti TaxID=1616106 RepID=A0A917QIQ9_9NOCA|nr:hypothetical protein GCM10011591_23040 [Nocardia camponoti]
MTSTLERLQIAVIIGSTRDGRFAPTVSDWFLNRARLRDDIALDVIDAADFVAGDSIAEKLDSADGFIIVTPELNHSYPGTLKNLIDAHFAEWQAKPVGFVSYGGVSGGLRAVEHLRGVFAELHAVTVRDSVALANPGVGSPRLPMPPTRLSTCCSTASTGGAKRFAKPARPVRTGSDRHGYRCC